MRTFIIGFFILSGLFFPTLASAADIGYAGTYSGTFSGGDSGTWTVSISPTGEITGAGANAKGLSGSLVGQGLPDGSITIGNVSSGATFTGKVNLTTRAISGTWAEASGGKSGTWSGTAISAPTNNGGSTACLSNDSNNDYFCYENNFNSICPASSQTVASCPTSNVLGTCTYNLNIDGNKTFKYFVYLSSGMDSTALNIWNNWCSQISDGSAIWSPSSNTPIITNPKVTEPAALIATGSFAEPNDTPAEATPILVNDQPLYQFFTSPGDEDWYEIFAKAGQNYTIDIPAASIGRLINPALELYDAAGNLLIRQANSSTKQFRWIAPSSGLFRIRVTNQPLVVSRAPATEAYTGEAVDYSYQIRVFLTDAPQQILTKGRVLDACDQGINEANVSVLFNGVSIDSTLTNKFGEFGLLLNPGSYTLNISATNYQQTSQNVTVGQQSSTLAPIKLNAAANSCVSNPGAKAQQTPAFYDDQLGLLTIKNIVVDDKTVYYVELKNIGDYRFQLNKYLTIPGVILDNPPTYSSSTELATLPEVFALTRNWKVQLKHAGNSVFTINNATPH